MRYVLLAGILSTLITKSSSLNTRNVTKGENTRVDCPYGNGEVRNMFWYADSNCSGEPIVRYFKGDIITSNKTRFWLEADNSTLILKRVTIADQGTYCCSVNVQGGALPQYEFRTKLNVFGLLPKTLPVITQCNTSDHDESKNCTLSLNAPTNLTCELRYVYPNQSVKLEWHGGGGDTITESHSNDDGTYTFVAKTNISEAGSFWCNASFPSEIGQVDTGVQVYIVVRDPARTSPRNIIVGVIVAVIFVLIVVCCLWWIYRRKQNRNTNGSDADTQGTEHEQRRQTEEGPEADSLVERDTEARTSTPDGREPDVQGTGHEPITEQPEGGTQAAPQSLPLTQIDAEAVSSTDTPDVAVLVVPHMQMDAEAGSTTPDGTHQESHHNTDISRCTTKISERILLNLAKKFPADCYYTLCLELKFSYNEGRNILEQNVTNYEKTFTNILMAWKNRTGGICRVLCAALYKADAGGLIPLIHNSRGLGIEEP